MNRLHAGWTAYQLSHDIALNHFESSRTKWQVYEDGDKRNAAIQRFHKFAYKWY
jgi:hypothetical protein